MKKIIVALALLALPTIASAQGTFARHHGASTMGAHRHARRTGRAVPPVTHVLHHRNRPHVHKGVLPPAGGGGHEGDGDEGE